LKPVCLVDQLTHGKASLDRPIDYEAQFWCGMDPQSTANAPTQEQCSPMQTFQSTSHCGIVTGQHGEPDSRDRVVGREVNPRQRDKSDPRVFDFTLEEFGQFALQLIGNPNSPAPRNGARFRTANH
jgi:hypothetical protein